MRQGGQGIAAEFIHGLDDDSLKISIVATIVGDT